MITLTKEQLTNYIELLAREVYSDYVNRIDVDEDDYCEVWCKDETVDSNCNEYIATSGYLINVFTELELEWLASK
jgi:hypothetical protein